MDLDLRSGLEALVKKYHDLPCKSVDEENTKTWFILPFFGCLGYNPHDPSRVKAQYSPDPEYKRTGKVDYVIFDQHGKPIIYVECKKLCEHLDSHRPQLKNYFNNSPSVKLALLTNGYEYRFYTDLERENVLDKLPFLSFNLETDMDEYLTHLSVFTRKNFSTDDIRLLAEKLVRRSKILKYLKDEIKNPSDNLAKYITKNALEERSKAVWSDVKSILPEILSELFKSGDVNDDREIDSDKVVEPEAKALSIFDIENAEYKYIEYFEFEGRCIDQYNKVTDMYIYVFKILFERDKNCVMNFRSSPVRTSDDKSGRAVKLGEDCFLWKGYSNNVKFTYLKKLLSELQMDKNTLRVKLRDKR